MPRLPPPALLLPLLQLLLSLWPRFSPEVVGVHSADYVCCVAAECMHFVPL
jgi:hypothetical protein